MKVAIQRSRQQYNKPGESSQCNDSIEIQKEKGSGVKYSCGYCKAVGHNASIAEYEEILISEERKEVLEILGGVYINFYEIMM
ncbi:unnamed protein product [Rhizophagus irregularis]|nr:unnamed protein product [Rhizophagus irregularis]CAB4420654.1 unnamed protein product [Rhizophagus irregularis]